jgi:hypothetical protein
VEGIEFFSNGDKKEKCNLIKINEPMNVTEI